MDIESPDVSVVIVNWRVRDHLLACLDSLYRCTRDCTFDVTVVDNASGDGSLEAVRLRFPQARLIENAENSGFARASNQGMRAGSGPLILLLNPDCLLQYDVLSLLAGYLRSHTRAALVGPRLLFSDGRDDVRSPRRLPSPAADVLYRLGVRPRVQPINAADRPPSERTTSGRVPAVSGACMMARRAALEQVGLLDEDFFLFGEDVDLCRRLQQAGWQIHFDGTTPIFHTGGASTSQAGDVAALHALASRELYLRKHHGPGAALVFRAYRGGMAALKIGVLAVLAPFSAGQRPRLRRQELLLAACLRGPARAAPGRTSMAEAHS